MSVTATISQTNGEFNNSITTTEFHPLSGIYTFSQNQLCKISLVDSENNNNDVSDIPVIATTNTPGIFGYNHTTGQWGTLVTSDLTGYNIVLKRQGVDNVYNAYFAKDDELNLIPNFIEEARIRYRINEKLDTSNYLAKKKISFLNNGNDGTVPLVPLTIYEKPIGMTICFIGIWKNQDNTFQFTYQYLQVGTATNTYGNSVMRFPTYSSFIETANSEIEDLDTRVSILESEVNELKLKVAAHDKLLKDLPALVSAVSENVSKLYVAR